MHAGLLGGEADVSKAKHAISPERPPSNQLYRSLHPPLASLHQRIQRPDAMKDAPRRFIEVTNVQSVER